MLTKKSIGKILLSAFVISSLVIAGDNMAEAKKKKSSSSTKSSKRSGSSKSAKKSTSSSKKSGSKRSASSKSSKRSASSKSSNARRAASNARRAASIKKNSSVASQTSSTSSKETSTSSTPVGKPCPIGRVLQLNSEDNLYYYAKKKTCDAPENAHEETWTSSSGLSKLGWIDQSEAVYFACDEGYTKKGNACIDAYGICPLNVALEKSGKNYINPNTDESCSIPAGATVEKLTSEEAQNAGFDSAYKFFCPENHYSSDLIEGYVAQCTPCKEGYLAPAGSTSKDACVAESTQCGDGTETCEDEVSTACKAGYILSNGECKICEKNTWSAGGTATECTACKTGYLAPEGSASADACVISTEYSNQQKNKYMNPVTTVNSQWNNGQSGTIELGVGCYKVIAYGGGGGASGSVVLFNNRWGQYGGYGGKVEAYFCVSEGTAKFAATSGTGGTGGSGMNPGANGVESTFVVTGTLDPKFSGVTSGTTVTATGGTGGSGQYTYSGSRATAGSCSGINTGLRFPSGYSYSTTGYGTYNNTFAQCGTYSNGGNAYNRSSGSTGGYGRVQIQTIRVRVSMY
ncbi:MAG: hypothetical protein IJ638_02090 [Alphaproteobacteria bacterium]|nr:hypothetical protein [Alphaproteobacteria bacterium]